MAPISRKKKVGVEDKFPTKHIKDRKEMYVRYPVGNGRAEKQNGTFLKKEPLRTTIAEGA